MFLNGFCAEPFLITYTDQTPAPDKALRKLLKGNFIFSLEQFIPDVRLANQDDQGTGKYTVNYTVYGNELDLSCTAVTPAGKEILTENRVLDRLKLLSSSRDFFYDFINKTIADLNPVVDLKLIGKPFLTFIFNERLPQDKVLVFNIYLEDDLGELTYLDLRPAFTPRMIYWEKAGSGLSAADTDLRGALEIYRFSKVALKEGEQVIIDNLPKEADLKKVIICYDLLKPSQYTILTSRQGFYRDMYVLPEMLPDALLRYKTEIELTDKNEYQIVF
ncbi:MAG TPA: hypothetical protein VKS21_13295, partial [Spirochaetota bacterium]|nr:hypothetical protein [Spirochaetota bacterium]